MILFDVAAERAVLAGICQYGDAAYYDIIDYIKESSFSLEINQAIFKCLKNIFDNNDNVQIDVPTIFSSAQELGLEHYFVNTSNSQHLQAILTLPIELSNVRRHAAKIRKLEITNLLHQQLGIAQNKLLDVKGNESITQILGIAEDAVFNFTSLLDDNDDEPTKMGNGIVDHIKYLEKNPVDQVGISTGFPVYDMSIGGGLRPGTINLIAARSKIGKSIIANNMAYHIAKNLNIPVLNLDTEMTKTDQLNRTIAMVSDVSINDIETGKFAKTPDVRERVYNTSQELESVPYYHKSIAGKPLEEQIALARRWITKEVGLNDDGTAQNCLIIYDYVKLMGVDDISPGMQEYQMLGFLMSTLHNFAVHYKIPILGLLQLNRDGINKEDTSTASSSDRIIWLCSNFTIFKNKSDEEIAEDGLNAGNKKLVPIVSRHGPGINHGDYINCKMDGWKAKVIELKTKFELERDEQDGKPIDF